MLIAWIEHVVKIVIRMFIVHVYHFHYLDKLKRSTGGKIATISLEEYPKILFNSVLKGSNSDNWFRGELSRGMIMFCIHGLKEKYWCNFIIHENYCIKSLHVYIKNKTTNSNICVMPFNRFYYEWYNLSMVDQYTDTSVLDRGWYTYGPCA